jgi:hypothetical protein
LVSQAAVPRTFQLEMKPPSGSSLLSGGQITQEMIVRRNTPNVSQIEIPQTFPTDQYSVPGRPKNEIASVLQMQRQSHSRAIRSERPRELKRTFLDMKQCCRRLIAFLSVARLSFSL